MKEQYPRLATEQEVAETLSFALRSEGRKRVYQADDIMAGITAERLINHLKRSGFIIMRGPPDVAPTDQTHKR